MNHRHEPETRAEKAGELLECFEPKGVGLGKSPGARHPQSLAAWELAGRMLSLRITMYC